ncbi:MAG: hypothetical protein AAFP70_22055, partial [Calditrichota bacterium]
VFGIKFLYDKPMGFGDIISEIDFGNVFTFSCAVATAKKKYHYQRGDYSNSSNADNQLPFLY